ncbi:MAG: XdhC family protein [Oscillospiraceae bacterium]|nr:XdhC family protein [Oscillospiraceae bacterium]
MREFIRAVVHSLEEGHSVELVSVVESGGSTPRGAGAMLAVFPGGRTAGTIGGGNVEYEAAKLAQALLETGEDALRRFRFVQGDAASLGMVCGGGVTVQFQYLPAGDGAVITILRDLLEATGKNADTWLVRRLEGERITAMGLADRTGFRYLDKPPAEAGLLANKAVFRDGWFAVPAVKAGRVYIFGGGHVSQALVPAAAAVGFRPVVYDDRPEFADKALFPRAEAVLCGSFEELPRQVKVTPDDYVVVMTRGHQADYEVLVQTLRSGAKYLGCIGSKRKLALCRDRLLEAGFTAEEYAKVHAPIGLAIGAETPEEIAVSVTAELIAVRAGV